MSKRKETRLHCLYAFRDRDAHTLTEFKLFDYDGEGHDMVSIISALHDVASMSGESLETKLESCLNLIREPNLEGEKPFLCKKLEITVLAEKIEEEAKKVKK